ncbi:MAG: hypothetical protein KGH49_02340 [Candidatus Micrarchaeota archaeon]|nr:hypothetical protein [Candidatus Micrarchaeota archaeon]
MERVRTLSKLRQRSLARSPTLDTILMVEKALYRYRSDKTITEIWKLLPRKVMWTTFKTVLEYLQNSGKILIADDKTVSWLWDPKGVERIKKEGVLVR